MKIIDLYKIAFLGDNDHGDKIISTLESWGGSNHLKRDGKRRDVAYFINGNGEIDVISTNRLLTASHYFLTWHYYNSQCHLKVGDSFNYGSQDYNVDSILYNINERCIVYKLKAFGVGVEYITNNDLIQNEEWPTEVESTGFMQMGKTVVVCFNKENYETEVELQLGDYEIEVRDGKTYAVLKKPKYPTTYDDCCDMLNADEFVEYELMVNFPKLINARNAYWKIAGEQMELDKPWEPDNDTEIYNIYRTKNIIRLGGACWGGNCNILEFPTEEMRDAFYKNFKDLIEECKELL